MSNLILFFRFSERSKRRTAIDGNHLWLIGIQCVSPSTTKATRSALGYNLLRRNLGRDMRLRLVIGRESSRIQEADFYLEPIAQILPVFSDKMSVLDRGQNQ